MHRTVILGAGKIGHAIAALLGHAGDFEVQLGDHDPRALARAAHLPNVRVTQLDVEHSDELATILNNTQSVISACPFTANPAIARAALAAGCSYFDLTEDVETTHTIRDLASHAKPGQIFMPQCGLAPGFIAILGHHLTLGFESLDEVQLRVGALAQFPTGALKYNLTWSTDGLINEYCNPCEVIRDGQPTHVLALEGLEHFSLDGVDYEAFNTSGGVGSLWQTLQGRVRNLDYKTVRYPGHRDLVHFLIRELRLAEQRQTLKQILEFAVPSTLQDVVVIFCAVTGSQNGMFMQVSDARKIYHGPRFGETWSAIQITTASAACAALDLHRQGLLPTQGFVKQEQVDLPSFLANRFGSAYAQPSASAASRI